MTISVLKTNSHWRIALVCATAVLAAGCSQNSKKYAEAGNKFPVSKYGPASARVVADGEDVPKGGGQNLVGKPYTIAGKTYYPAERPNYAAVGMASWYGSDFHGRKTANGEIFDRLSITAAHPTMPLPSYARVTNLRNNNSIVVRVNDRGPYHGGRVMDVSEKVAEALEFKGQGTAKVKVEYLARASLAGSDDHKLLASLRTDGSPATLDGLPTQPLMVAERPAPAQQVASLKPVAAQQPQVVESVSEEQEAEVAAPQGAPETAQLANVPRPVARPFNVGASQALVKPLAAPAIAPLPSANIAAAPVKMAPNLATRVARTAPLIDPNDAPVPPGKLSALYYTSDLPPVERFAKNGPFRKLHPRSIDELLGPAK